MLVQMCGAWRLRKCGFNFLMNNLDLANAFGSTDWEALEEANRLILTDDDLHFWTTKVQVVSHWTSNGGGRRTARLKQVRGPDG